VTEGRADSPPCDSPGQRPGFERQPPSSPERAKQPYVMEDRGMSHGLTGLEIIPCTLFPGLQPGLSQGGLSVLGQSAKRALPGGLDQPDDLAEGRRVALDRAGASRPQAQAGLGRSGFGGGFHFKLKCARRGAEHIVELVLPGSFQFVALAFTQITGWILIDCAKSIFSASRTNWHIAKILICSYQIRHGRNVRQVFMIGFSPLRLRVLNVNQVDHTSIAICSDIVSPKTGESTRNQKNGDQRKNDSR
jgi:hypothetical protein